MRFLPRISNPGHKKIGGPNIETRYSIYEAFGIGGLARGATWDPFVQKMFGFGKNWVHKLANFYEKWSEMSLESTVLDETRGKWSQIA